MGCGASAQQSQVYKAEPERVEKDALPDPAALNGTYAAQSSKFTLEHVAGQTYQFRQGYMTGHLTLDGDKYVGKLSRGDAPCGMLRIEKMLDGCLVTQFQVHGATEWNAVLRAVPEKKASARKVEARIGPDTGPAPYLRTYFDEQIRQAQASIDAQEAEPMRALDMAVDLQGLKERRDRHRAQLFHILTPLIEQSFDHHDIAEGSEGMLVKQESELFFKHYVDEEGRFMAAMQEMLTEEIVENIAFVVAPEWGRMRLSQQDKGKVEQACTEVVSAVKSEVKEQIKQYQSNKFFYDREAFKVIDVNRDGKLRKDEIVQALLPGTAQNTAFRRALGIDHEEIVQRHSVKAKQTECVQQ